MRKLIEGVWTWSVWKQDSFRGVAFNGYYLELGDERVVVDPPPLTSWDSEHLTALGAPTQVVITNAHHFRAAAEVCEQFDAALHVPAADADLVPREGASSFGDGDDLFGLEVLGLKDQKTPGESALYWAERKLLIVGDALIGAPAGSLCMLPAAKYRDVDAARAGLGRLAEREIEVLLTGDGDPILGGAAAPLRTLLAGSAPEAALTSEGSGLVPKDGGWFVLNLSQARWMGSEDLGTWTALESARGRFAEVGVNVTILEPGQPASRYHVESTQEGFLVLKGRCRLIIAETERLLEPWDYVHCPAGTAHVFTGAGDGPCAILMLGARRRGSDIHYPTSPAAARFGASVATACDNAKEAYEGVKPPVDVEQDWPI